MCLDKAMSALTKFCKLHSEKQSDELLWNKFITYVITMQWTLNNWAFLDFKSFFKNEPKHNNYSNRIALNFFLYSNNNSEQNKRNKRSKGEKIKQNIGLVHEVEEWYRYGWRGRPRPDKELGFVT